jgi:hypothetical protein
MVKMPVRQQNVLQFAPGLLDGGAHATCLVARVDHRAKAGVFIA